MESKLQKNIYDKILQSAATIGKASRIGAGDYIIASRQMSDIISEIISKTDRRKKKIGRIWKTERLS